jgi:hypothetical protein
MDVHPSCACIGSVYRKWMVLFFTFLWFIIHWKLLFLGSKHIGRVSIEGGRNVGGMNHGGLLMPHAASSLQRMAEVMVAASFNAAKFVAPVAARSGCNLLPYPSSQQHLGPLLHSSTSVHSSWSHSMSLTTGETSRSQCASSASLPALEHRSWSMAQAAASVQRWRTSSTAP